MIETPLALGSHRNLFGIRTEVESRQGHGVIILNAGFLHHIGPFRLHVAAARMLAEAGCPAIRLDLSGKGESPSRPGVSVDEAVLLDFDDAREALAELGADKIILLGLCSGADDAMYIASKRNGIAGLALIDPFALRTRRYYIQRYRSKILRPDAWLRWFGRQGRRLTGERIESSSVMDIRNWSSADEMLAVYHQLLQQHIRLLALFSSGVSEYYNYGGQLTEALGETAADELIDEIHYPDADHVFSIASQRERLLTDILDWTSALGATESRESDAA